MNGCVQVPLNAEWPFFGLLAFMKAKRPKKGRKKSWSQNAWNCLIRPENQKKIFPTFLAWGPRSPRSEVTRSALFEAADPFYMCRQTFWHTSLVWKWRDVSIPNFLRIYHCAATAKRIMIGEKVGLSHCTDLPPISPQFWSNDDDKQLNCHRLITNSMMIDSIDN